MFTTRARYWIALTLPLFLQWASLGTAQTVSAADQVRAQFATPPDDARVMMRWWWFGPAVSEAELKREIAAMKAGGYGGFEIQPVYPLSLDDPSIGLRNLTYLSDEFIGALRFAAKEGVAQGLRVDVTLGSGWPFGGPHVPSQRVGSVWAPPYEIEITPHLNAGVNELEVRVGNLALNTLAGRAAPDYRLLNLRYGERFQPQDMENLQPLPAGLIGTSPITVLAEMPSH